MSECFDPQSVPLDLEIRKFCGCLGCLRIPVVHHEGYVDGDVAANVRPDSYILIVNVSKPRNSKTYEMNSQRYMKMCHVALDASSQSGGFGS